MEKLWNNLHFFLSFSLRSPCQNEGWLRADYTDYRLIRTTVLETDVDKCDNGALTVFAAEKRFVGCSFTCAACEIEFIEAAFFFACDYKVSKNTSLRLVNLYSSHSLIQIRTGKITRELHSTLAIKVAFLLHFASTAWKCPIFPFVLFARP